MTRFLTMILFLSLLPITAEAQPVVSNREPELLEVGYLPRDEQTVDRNPPAFAWLADSRDATYTLQVASDSAFSKLDLEATTPLLLYTHSTPLTVGKHFWRYCYETSSAISNWSKVRAFEISPDSIVFPRPTRNQLTTLVPTSHPRMLMRPENLGLLRSMATDNNADWNSLRETADRAISVPLMKEPRPWSDGTWNAREWGTYLRQISSSSPVMETLAMAYLMTGKAEYGARAREWLLGFASWDPLGPSGMRVNDEVGMVVLYSCSRTYSWLHGFLTEPEREQVRKMIRARGNDTYRRLRKYEPYEQFAFNSHNGRIWHFLGEAGLAFHGEIPEAGDWLEYAITIFYGWYPIWGDSDGGWNEGLHYFTSYNERFTWWLDQMREVLGIDGTIKPFYSNVGEFPLHVAPPHAVIQGFGDFSEKLPPPGRGRVMAAYAAARKNKVWQWYAERVGSAGAGAVFQFLGSSWKVPPPEPPTSGTTLKLFGGVGWSVMNTELRDARYGIQLMMRCSPLGNFSHSHCDQNNVVLAAYGVPLLVNTGVRDYYGSPFCQDWYWQTKAHNCLLVDGVGQSRGASTRGQILNSGKTENLMFCAGDATRAYPGRVTRYRRTMALVDSCVVALLDDIQSTASEVSLAFHSRQPFQMVDGAGFDLQSSGVLLSARILSSAGAAFSQHQTDQYSSQPVPGTVTLPEWHYTVSFPGDQSRRRIATLMSIAGPGSKPVLSSLSFTESERMATLDFVLNGKKRRLSFDIEASSVLLE